MSEVQSYVGLGYHLESGHVFRLDVGNLQECGYLNAQVCAAASDIQAAVDKFMRPDVTLPARANAVALGQKPKAPKTPGMSPAEITTLVLNGTTTTGLARDTAYKLAVAGFHTNPLPPTVRADTPTPTYSSNYVYYDAVQARSKQAARQLAIVMGPNTKLAAMPPEIASYAQQASNPLTVVVVGTAFAGTLVDPQAGIVEVPKRQPPATRSDPSVTENALRAVRSQIAFRIMVPTIIHGASALAQLEPLRVFRPYPHKKEVVVTFVTGAANVYWQIIQTDWTTAPILRNPTRKVTLEGRRYELFTNAIHIHMVVLRRANTSYWVVNTLRDELSNETMLAIAKGLQPLGT
jgi:hypothetical protein